MDGSLHALGWMWLQLVHKRFKGDRRGTWAVQVSGNWRVTFRFVGPDVSGVNYEDYH